MPVLLITVALAVIGLFTLSTFLIKGKSADDGVRRYEDEEQVQALRDGPRRSIGQRTAHEGATRGYETTDSTRGYEA